MSSNRGPPPTKGRLELSRDYNGLWPFDLLLIVPVVRLPKHIFCPAGHSRLGSVCGQEVTKIYKLSSWPRTSSRTVAALFARNRRAHCTCVTPTKWDPAPAQHFFGILQDAKTGKTFRIDYGRKRVTVMRTPPPDTFASAAATDG